LAFRFIPRFYFGVQNSLGSGKRFLRNLYTIWIHGLKRSATRAAKYEAGVLVDGTGGVDGADGAGGAVALTMMISIFMARVAVVNNTTSDLFRKY